MRRSGRSPRLVETVYQGVKTLLGLSALEINLTPLLTVIGAAGFVVACALQGTKPKFPSVLNTANVGWFSSDRTIAEYAKEIWNAPFAPIS